jgi:hypothetical protein
MAEVFNKEEYEALNVAVGGIVERAIASLQGVGMTYEGALSLLVIQAVIRMRNTTEARRLLKSLEMDWLADDNYTTGGLS